MAEKAELLSEVVSHWDLKQFDCVPWVDAMGKMAFQAKNLSRAAQIYQMMLEDPECTIILCLAGSLFSAGLKKIVVDLVRYNMVDAIVSTGAILVDQDFFEAIGFQHYQGSPRLDDAQLREMAIDRIYDTLIDEDQLRICDQTVAEIADHLPPCPYSSRQFLREMGQYLERRGCANDSVVLEAFRKQVPLFVPAFSDCSAGFGLVMHQTRHPNNHLTLDSAGDFRELTQIKIAAKDTGLVMVGGGVPKNFAQDAVVAAEMLGENVPMHKYAIQVTVADERDGGLSGSTLREASSWGKVATTHEQMVYCEATIAIPLIAGYAYGKGSWKTRSPRNLSQLFEDSAK